MEIFYTMATVLGIIVSCIFPCVGDYDQCDVKLYLQLHC